MVRLLKKVAELPKINLIRERVNNNQHWQRFWQKYLSDRARAAKKPELMIRSPRERNRWQQLDLNGLTEYREFEVQAEDQIPPFIFSSFDGVFVFARDRIFRLWPEAVYGVAWIDESLLLLTVSRKKSQTKWSRLLALKPMGRGVVEVRPILELDTFFNLHSLDTFEDRIYLPLTTINGPLTYDYKSGKYWTNLLGPKTVFKNGRNTSLYCHYNTIFIDRESVWLMAHSGLSNKDENSEIHRFNRSGLVPRTGRVIPDHTLMTAGHWGHDIFISEGDIFWCSSFEGKGMRNQGEMVRTEPGFMSRGLDWDGEYLIMGGSEIAKQHEVREYASSCLGIWACDSDPYRKVAQFSFPNLSGIQDVRFLMGSRALSDPGQRNAPKWLT